MKLESKCTLVFRNKKGDSIVLETTLRDVLDRPLESFYVDLESICEPDVDNYDYEIYEVLTESDLQRELLISTLNNRVLRIQSEPDGITRETMINNLLIDIKN